MDDFDDDEGDGDGDGEDDWTAEMGLRNLNVFGYREGDRKVVLEVAGLWKEFDRTAMLPAAEAAEMAVIETIVSACRLGFGSEE